MATAARAAGPDDCPSSSDNPLKLTSLSAGATERSAEVAAAADGQAHAAEATTVHASFGPHTKPPKRVPRHEPTLVSFATTNMQGYSAAADRR